MTFRRINYTHHPLSQAEIERAALMFGCRRDTMKIRDYLQEERHAHGVRHHVYEWQIYNALSAFREQALDGVVSSKWTTSEAKANERTIPNLNGEALTAAL